MKAAPPSVRRIERASTMLVGLLAAQGLLPFVPPHVAALAERPEAVKPSFELADELTYLLARQGDAVAGVAAYHDRFDYHIMRPVREIVTITGSRRAVIDLVLHVISESNSAGRTVIGAIEPENESMAAIGDHFMRRKRVIWEAP